jgi:hypothetical protein
LAARRLAPEFAHLRKQQHDAKDEKDKEEEEKEERGGQEKIK